MKSKTVSFRVSFRYDDFYLGELYPHLLSMKSEREASNEIKKILFSGKRLEKHNEFPCDEFSIPKFISIRIYISDRDFWLDPLREKLLAYPSSERAFLLKRMVFDIYVKNLIIPQKSYPTPSTEGEKSQITTNNKENSPDEAVQNSGGDSSIVAPRQASKAVKSGIAAALDQF